MKTVTYSAPTMHCTACVMLLEGLEDEVPGISSVEASLKRCDVVITYDETLVDEQAILAAAEVEGYTLTKLQSAN